MNRRTKIIVSVAGIFIVTLLLIGLTYAYFLTRINGNTNDKSISVTTDKLELTYGDGSTNILTTSTPIQPSNTEVGTKDFTVTNNGNDTEYVVFIENVSIKDVTTNRDTTYESNDFRYELTCTSTIGECNSTEEQEVFPINGGILLGTKIKKGAVHNYTFKFYYIETGDNQSNDMNKTINAKINIEDIRRVNPYKSGTLAYNIINNAANKTNGTELRVTPLTPFTGISEYEGGKYIYETVDASSFGPLGCSNWLVGDSEEAAKTGSSVSSFDAAVGKYVYNPYQGWTKKLISYDSNTNILTFEVPEMLPEKTLSTALDDYGTSYYYRGAVQDNYVSFAGFTWRIVRINGDGSIRLILDGTLDKVKKVGETEYAGTASAFNTNIDQNAYIGYTYGTAGSSDYDTEHKFTGDKTTYNPEDSSTTAGHSTVKVNIDKFYKKYLTSYSDYISDEIFCGDKSLAKSSIGYGNTALGYGTNTTYYAAAERLWYSDGNTSITKATPTLKCASGATNNYSRYTLNGNSVNGVETNGNLTYPIALLSADELVMAGAFKWSKNQTYYLYDAYKNGTSHDYWWTMSPYSFSDSYSNVFSSDGASSSLSSYIVYDTRGSRPVINLRSDVLVSTGDGTKDNAYTVRLP